MPVRVSSQAERPPPEETAVRMAISRIAIRSSTIRTPTTSSGTFPETFCSSNALAMMVVLEMAMIAPAKTLSSTVQPKTRPRPKPSHTITLLWSTAMIPAVGATRNSLRRLNSSPSENISRMTPELGERVHEPLVGDEREPGCAAR